MHVGILAQKNVQWHGWQEQLFRPFSPGSKENQLPGLMHAPATQAVRMAAHELPTDFTRATNSYFAKARERIHCL